MDRSTGIEIYFRVPHAALSKMELVKKDKRCGESCLKVGRSASWLTGVVYDSLVSVL
jgi:hypothetical protein